MKAPATRPKHLARRAGRRDVYLLEAADTDTLVRLRSATPVHDVRRFAELVERFEPFGEVQ